ncbi:sensor histidine kinase [Flavobacterium sp. Arc3]
MNFTSNKLYKISVTHHVIFWLIYFSFNTFRWGSYFNDFLYSFKSNLLGFPIHMILCYLNIFVLMPYLVYKKKYFSYIIAILLALLIMMVVKFELTYYLLGHKVWPEGPQSIDRINLTYAIDTMIGELYVITFATAIKITLDFLNENKRAADLTKIQLETELLFLKAQVSPHFFFNTLNNIYSLSVDRSDKTPKIILKLSELMRYMIYETKNGRQSLENEILCIQNYLDLERIRHDNRLQVNMAISGDIEDKKIAPILLLSFIENAFKHGVNKNIGNVKVDIKFKIKEDFLYFSISNPMPNTIISEENINATNGIGLANVTKRLELGYKKNDYKLTIKNKNNSFVVKLKIRVS